VSFLDYVHKGQIVDFEVECVGKSPKYMARIENINDTTLSIIIVEDDFSIKDSAGGIKGFIQGKKKGLPFSLYVEAESITDSGVMLLKHIPARTHLRVDTFIPFKYQKITAQEFQSRRKQQLNSGTIDSDGHLLALQRYGKEESDSTSPVSAEIIAELYSINKKLDFIIKALGKPEEKNIAGNDRIEVNISGAGVKFKCPEDFQPGDFLEIAMVLPISSGSSIEFIGEVVRCACVSQGIHEQKEKINEVAVKYAAINEDDREFIIRYVFKRQRELLRAEENILE